MKNVIEKHALLLICLLFLFSIGLKSIHLWDNVFFAYDQARDAQRISQIASFGDFKLVGPETDISGVFNGPLFYYLMTPVYALSHFDPNYAALFVLLINASSIFLIYALGKTLFKSKGVGVVGGFLWAISYEQADYSRYISNASFMGISTLVFFLGLALYFLRDKKYGLPLSVVGYAAAIHFNIYLAYLGLFYPICYLIYKKKLTWKQVFLNGAIFVVLMLPFILAEIKWHFMMTSSLLHFAGGQSAPAVIGDDIGRYLTSFMQPIHNSFFAFNTFLGFLLTLLLLMYLIVREKDKKVVTFFLLCLFSTFPLYGFNSGVLTVQVVNSPLLPFYTLLFAFAIAMLWKTPAYRLLVGVLLLFIIGSNLMFFVQSNFSDDTLFSTEPLLLRDEKSAIDYTYQAAHGQEFSVCAVTNPLFVNTVWGFLYSSYGKKMYGSLPLWSGQKQTLAESLLPYDINHVQTRFLIIEPLVGISPELLTATVYEEDHASTLQEVKKFGTVTVQKRLLQNEPRKFIDTQGLSKAQLASVESITASDPRYSCYNQY